jgi:hypothetical protein
LRFSTSHKLFAFTETPRRLTITTRISISRNIKFDYKMDLSSILFCCQKGDAQETVVEAKEVEKVEEPVAAPEEAKIEGVAESTPEPPVAEAS